MDGNTQGRLVAAMRAGELPDSIETETIPVETETHRSGVFVETIETFEDGSIRVVQVQDLPGAVAHPADLEDKGTMPLAHRGASVPAGVGSISNCSISSGSGYSNYTNCMVRGSTGQISNWFYADWTIVQGTFNDRITATRNAGQTCTWPYNCSIPSRTQYVQKESVSTTAGATYRGSWSAVIGSGTTYLNLVVGKNTYSASFTTP